MKIDDQQELDSLCREAGRQQFYYSTRNEKLHLLWKGIQRQALLALTENHPLLIQGELKTPLPIIKPGEQRFDGIIPLPPQ